MMKYRFSIVFFLFGTLLQAQIFLEFSGGVGYDMAQIEDKFLSSYTPTHVYIYNGNTYPIEYVISNPQSVGLSLFWKFAPKLGISAGLESKFIKRDIWGDIYVAGNTTPAHSELKINIEYLSWGLLLRKDISINAKSKLFFQISMSNIDYIGFDYFQHIGSPLEYAPASTWQVVQYRPDLPSYSLIRSMSSTSGKEFSFKQGGVFYLKERFGIGIASYFSFQTDIVGTFVIQAWSPVSGQILLWNPTPLRFRTLSLDLFLTYEF